MKSKEELNALKEEVETLNKKLHELTEEELAQVSGGGFLPVESEGNDVIYFQCPLCGKTLTDSHICDIIKTEETKL